MRTEVDAKPEDYWPAREAGGDNPNEVYGVLDSPGPTTRHQSGLYQVGKGAQAPGSPDFKTPTRNDSELS